MDGYPLTVHGLNGDVVLQRQCPPEMQIWDIKKQCQLSSSPRLMSLSVKTGPNNIVLGDQETLKSVAVPGAGMEIMLALTLRPLKILILEGMGMIGPDSNVDTDSILEELGDLDAESDGEGIEDESSYKEVLCSKSYTVTCLKYDLDDISRIRETKALIKDSDVTVLCESHVCPSKVSSDLNDTLSTFVHNGGWFLHTGATDSGSSRLFPSLFHSLPQRRLHSTKAASSDHRAACGKAACAQINPMYRILQSVREGKLPMSEADKGGLEAECSKYGFEVKLPEGDHANAYACPTENSSFERLFPDSASLKLTGNFLCFREDELDPAHSYFRMSTGYGVPVVSMRCGKGRVTSFGALLNRMRGREGNEVGFPVATVLAAHIRAAQSLVGTECAEAAELHSGRKQGQKRLIFHQGMQVQATGLSRRADLNGKVGTVKGKKAGSDSNPRIVVAFIVDGVEESMMCRPENLKDAG